MLRVIIGNAVRKVTLADRAGQAGLAAAIAS